MKIIIVDRSYGQLGNNLYKLSNIISYAKENNCLILDRSFYARNYARYFPQIKNRLFLTFPDSPVLKRSPIILQLSQSFIIKCLAMTGVFRVSKTFCDTQRIRLDNPEEVKALSGNKKIVQLSGFHYIGGKSIVKHAEFIRHLFRPDDLVMDIAHSFLRKIRKGRELVAVHIRRGDYKDWRGGKYFFSLKYYNEAMLNLIRSSDEEVAFLIFSDDQSILVDEFDKKLNIVKFEIASEIQDLYTMSCCDYIIGPALSTYSGWASFYGEVPTFKLDGKKLPKSFNCFKYLPCLDVFSE